MKTIAITPAGRQKYLEILAAYIFRDRNRGVLDQWMIWVNTPRENDVKYCRYLQSIAPDFVKLVEHDQKIVKPMPQPPFFRTAIDPDAVYVKFDDDICWVAENAIEEIVRFRLENPDYFMIMANTVCNGFCAAIHQRNGTMSFKINEEIVRMDRHYDNKLYRNPHIAEYVHKTFIQDRLNNDLEKYEFPEYPLDGYSNFSINCIAWEGKEFAKFGGKVEGDDEERWLCTVKSRELSRQNCVCGTSLVSHFAFYTHRKPFCKDREIDHRILDSYRLLAQKEVGEEICKKVWDRDYLSQTSDQAILNAWQTRILI